MKGLCERALALLLCVSLVFGLNPASALATELNQQEGVSASELALDEDVAADGEASDAELADDSMLAEGTSSDEAASEAVDGIAEQPEDEAASELALDNATNPDDEDAIEKAAELLTTSLGTKSTEDESRTTNTATATVSYTAQMDDKFTVAPQVGVTVRGDLAESYGYTDSVTDGVSVLDVLVDAHVRAFGEDFTLETARSFLDMNSSGFINTIFCEETSSCGFVYNDSYAYDGAYGATVTTQAVYDGDTVNFFLYQDVEYYMDFLTWFCQHDVYVPSITSNGSEPIELSVAGYMFAYCGDYYKDAASLHAAGEAIDSARVGWVDVETGAIDECAIADEDGNVSVTPPTEEGTYYLTAYYTEEDAEDMGYPLIMPLLPVVVDASYVPPVVNPSGLSNLEVMSFQSNPSALALTPKFNSDVYEYTAPEVAYEEISVFRSFYVRATSLSADATMTATLNGENATILTSGTLANFMRENGLKPGANKLVVTVTNDESTTTYTVNVSMFDPNAPVGPEPLEPIPSQEELDKLANATAAYLASTITSPTFSSLGGEWAVIGQARGSFEGASSFTATYAKNLAAELARTNGVLSKSTYTDYSRVILALTAAGYDVTDFAGYNLLQPLADMQAVAKQGVNGPIWTLIALDSHGYDIPAVEGADKMQATREGLIGAIVDAQLENGGWNIAGDRLDVDMTSMALLALAPYASDAAANAAVEAALAGLESFLADDANAAVIANLGPDSYAQLISALIACGVDVATDVRFGVDGKSPISKLVSFASEDGTFSRTLGGKADLRATEQSLLALVAYQRSVDGSGSLYDMKDVIIDKHQSPMQGPEEENPVVPTNPQQPAKPTTPQTPESPSAGNNANGNSSNANAGNPSEGSALYPGGSTTSLPAPNATSPESEQEASASTDQAKDTAVKATANVADSENPLSGTEDNSPSPFLIVGIALIVLGVAGALFFLMRRSAQNR